MGPPTRTTKITAKTPEKECSAVRMSESQVLRAWEERSIRVGKGSRIVHYILKDSIGNSVVAVVGRERCFDHMVYTISEDFLRVFGSTTGVCAGKKWQARQEVVDWLVSVVSRGGPILANSTQSNHTQAITEKVARCAHAKPPLQASKRVKKCKLSEILRSSYTSKTDKPVVKWEPTCNKVRIKPLNKRPLVLALPAYEIPCKVFPKYNENVELLSQDSGMRGCWFRCKILLASKTHLKVQYKDVLQGDGPEKLEESVPASRVAARDKLGVRCVGRLTIRPRPFVDSSDTTFVVGSAVDVWLYNGWWEGVVIGYETLKNTSLQVYFPGENKFSTVARKNIRVSRDWINSRWVNIKARHDILSFLSSIFSPRPRLTPYTVIAAANGSATSSKVPSPRRCEEPEVDEWKIPSLTASTVVKAAERLNLKKQIISRYNEEHALGRL